MGSHSGGGYTVRCYAMGSWKVSYGTVSYRTCGRLSYDGLGVMLCEAIMGD